MEGIALIRMIYEVDCDVKFDFFFQNSHAYTITSKEFENINPDHGKDRLVHGIEIPAQDVSEFGYLVIDSTVEIKSYDSLGEGSAKIRPQLLVILGIISFLADLVLIPANSFEGHSLMVKEHISKGKSKNRLIVGDRDLTQDLNRLLDRIEAANHEQKVLFYSVFERWRKAVYLEQQSEDSLIFIDEAVLAYMHILEVLSDEYKQNLQRQIDSDRANLIEQLMDRFKEKDQPTAKKVNSLVNQLAEIKVTFKSKILQMLEELGLKNPKSEAIIFRFVNHRNAIAHGRSDIYQDKMVYPLEPFFSLIKDIDEEIMTIKFLCANVISKYFDLKSWTDYWEYGMLREMTPISMLKFFIEEKRYLNISSDDFFSGKDNGIFPATLSHYYVRGSIKFKELEEVITPFMNFEVATKAICYSLFEVSIILADSQNKRLSDKAIEVIETMDRNRWDNNIYSNIRDVIKHHEYFGIKLIRFENWLITRSQK